MVDDEELLKLSQEVTRATLAAERDPGDIQLWGIVLQLEIEIEAVTEPNSIEHEAAKLGILNAQLNINELLRKSS